MRSRQYDSVLCPLAFHMSQTIFKDHQMPGTNTHTSCTRATEYVTNCETCTAVIIVFFCLRICSDNMWSSHFIPHVKRHYSCCFPLIDSSFFHFICSQRVWGLQALLPYFKGHFEEQEKESNKDERAHKFLCLTSVFLWIEKCLVLSVWGEKKEYYLGVPVALYENSSYDRWDRATVQQSLHCLPSMMRFINTIQHQTQWMRCAPGHPHGITRHNQLYCEMNRKHKWVMTDCNNDARLV